MSEVLSKLVCPHCGAPITTKAQARYAICVFCNTSSTLSAPSAGGSGPAVVQAQAVSPADIDRVKQLLVDGKRDEAISLYASLASVSREDAAAAVENVFISSFTEIIRHLPIGMFGVVFHMVWILIGAGVASWGASGVAEGSLPHVVPLALGALLALYRIFVFGRHLRATYTYKFGATGRGRVLRRAVVREKKEADEYFIVVQFEVTPDDGSAVFVDQETLFVGSATLAKLAANNVVLVRFDGARNHVYPSSPVTVVG